MPPVFDYFKAYQAITAQSGKSELYTSIAYGCFFGGQLGYSLVISRLRSGCPILMAGYWGLFWGDSTKNSGFYWVILGRFRDFLGDSLGFSTHVANANDAKQT